MQTNANAQRDLETLTALNRDFTASVQNGDVKRFEEILADDFSPYVTKGGGISLPVDCREKFLHRKRTRLTGSLPKFGGPFHSLRTKRRGIESHGSVTRVELLRIKGKGFIS
jgi:hypothetical protein